MARDSFLYYTKKIPSEPIANFTFKNNSDLTFTDVSEDWGLNHLNFSNGATYADLDNDGDLELILNNIDQEAQIYRNNSKNNYLKVKLIGSSLNPDGIGSRVYVETTNNSQMQELTLSRGFQSSVSTYLNFGIGNENIVKSVKVVWPDGNFEVFEKVNANTTINFDINNSQIQQSNQSENLSNKFFENQKIVEHRHVENIYNDYDKEVLLPHENSKLGPGIVTGDLNSDGLEDFIIGGAINQSTSCLLYTSPSPRD